MSIFAYTGMPRSGKSYNAVANVILPALRDGRRVVTNVPLYEDKIRALVQTGEIVVFPVLEVQQNPDLIRKYVTPGSVFVLDEVWRLWPAGEKGNKTPEAYKSLLAEHGHMVDERGNATSITLVVQDIANIGSFARRLIEQTFIHTKLTHVGLDKRFRIDIFHGPVAGATGPSNNRLREVMGKYEPEVYDLYKSHTMSEAAADGANERHTDRRGNVLMRPMLLVGAIAVPVLIAGGIWGVSHFVHARTAPGAPPSSVRTSAAPVAAGTSSSMFSNMGHTVRGAVAALRPYRVLGTVINLSDPSKSIAYVVSGGDKVGVVRPLEACHRRLREPMECELEGVWYSETGASRDAGDSGSAGSAPGGSL
jgi:zona occludens toxin